MGSRKDTDLRVKRTHLVDASAVDALAVVEQPAADDVLLKLVHTLVELRLGVGVLLLELGVYGIVNDLQVGVTDVLVVGVHRGADAVDGEGLDVLEHVGVDFLALELELFLADGRLYLVDEGDDLSAFLKAAVDAFDHDFVGNHLGAGFDHDDLLIGGGDGHGHLADLALLGGGVDDVFTVDVADADGADRSVPRNIGDRDGDGGTDHGYLLGLAVGVHAHDGVDHADVVAHILREQRADGAVDDAGGEDRLLAGSSLSAEEAAGDPAHGIELLFVVDGKREIIDALTGRFGRRRGRKHDGVAVSHQRGSVGELRESAGLDLKLTAGDLGLENSHFLKHSFTYLRLFSPVCTAFSNKAEVRLRGRPLYR